MFDKDSATPEEKALRDEGKAELEKINGFIQYSEIVEALKSGKPVELVLSERKARGIEGPKDKTAFDVQREKALDYIINTEVIQQGLPELAAITDPADRRKLIEETLVVDPALRKKILEKMISVAERAKALPEAPIGNEVKDAEANKDLAEGEIRKNLDLIKSEISKLGFDAKKDELAGNVERLIGEGYSVDQALGFLDVKLKGQLKDFNAIGDYTSAGHRKNPDGTFSINDQKIITDFEGKLGTDPKLAAEYAIYNKIEKVLSKEKTSSPEGERYSSTVANGIDQIIKSQKIILDANKIIENGDLAGKQDAWKAGRLVEESNLISETKNILSSSVVEILSERYDEMVGLERQRMAKVAEEEAKKGNKAIESGIRNVKYAIENRWIKYDKSTRKREVHDYHLGSDVKYAAYAGEDGIRRLILRDSGLQMKDAAGNPVSVDWKNVNLNLLPDDVKKTLEGVYADQKDSYKQKLFGDFFLGRNFASRTIFGKPMGELALKKHEYELLQRNFGEAFEKSITAKADGKAMVEELKAKGVKMNGGLLAILALLLFGPAMAAKKALTG